MRAIMETVETTGLPDEEEERVRQIVRSSLDRVTCAAQGMLDGQAEMLVVLEKQIDRLEVITQAGNVGCRTQTSTSLPSR